MIVPKIVTDFIQTWLFVRQPKTSGLPIVIGGKVYRVGYPTARRCREIERLIELPDYEQYAEVLAQLQTFETLISETEFSSEGVDVYRKKIKVLEERIEAWKSRHEEFGAEVRKIARSERSYELWNALVEGGLDPDVSRETMVEYLLEQPDTMLFDLISFFLAWRGQISNNMRQKSMFMIQKEQKQPRG